MIPLSTAINATLPAYSAYPIYERIQIILWRVPKYAWLDRNCDPLGIMQQLRFYYKDTIYMHNSKSAFENEKHKILTLKRIMHSRPEEENVPNNGFREANITRSKRERKWKAVWIFARELKRFGQHDFDSREDLCWNAGKDPEKAYRKNWKKWKRGGVKINNWNIKKSALVLKRFAVS